MLKCVKFLFALLLLITLLPAHGATINFSDGDFNLPPWSSITIDGVVGGQTSSQVLMGGNPDSFFSVTTNGNLETFTAHTNESFVYDPAMGAIDSLDISLDYRNINSFGQGHGVSAVLAMQDGNVFAGGSFITGSSDFTWQNISFDGLTAANFGLALGSGELDFSTSGAPITFGFRTGNSGGNGINVGYDNYNLSLHTTVIPIPAGLPLLASALMTFGWLQRRSSSSST